MDPSCPCLRRRAPGAGRLVFSKLWEAVVTGTWELMRRIAFSCNTVQGLIIFDFVQERPLISQPPRNAYHKKS